MVVVVAVVVTVACGAVRRGCEAIATKGRRVGPPVRYHKKR